MTTGYALVTGASAGLGQAFARQLAADGKDLVLVARRTEPMEALAGELKRAHGVDVRVIQKDLSLAASPREIFDTVIEQGLEVDYLVNNAGCNAHDLLDEPASEVVYNYLQLMMISVVALCHLFIPPMRERGYGRVLNVSSVAGLVATPGDYSYGPTKVYLVAFSRQLANALQPDGINVTALCPGFTHTNFHASEKLAKQKRSLPKFIWYDADVVAQEGMQALEKGRDVYVSGRLYRYLVPLLRSPFGRLMFFVLRFRR